MLKKPNLSIPHQIINGMDGPSYSELSSHHCHFAEKSPFHGIGKLIHVCALAACPECSLKVQGKKVAPLFPRTPRLGWNWAVGFKNIDSFVSVEENLCDAARSIFQFFELKEAACRIVRDSTQGGATVLLLLLLLWVVPNETMQNKERIMSPEVRNFNKGQCI
jgi:hypothetical protein